MTLHTGGLFRLAVLVALAGAFCAPVHAQTGACPTSAALAVNPSGWVCLTIDVADYNATYDADGSGPGAAVPAVTRLDLLLFAPGKNTATDAADQTINIGKPTPNAQGALWVQVAALASLPLGQTWKARAVAIGQPLTAGAPAQVSARSPESNPFLRPLQPPAPPVPASVSVPGS